MKQKKLVIIGNTSNARLAHYFFSRDSNYEVVSFSVDARYIKESTFCDIPVVALEQLEENFPPDKYDVFVAVGYTNMNQVRESLYLKMKKLHYSMPNYISSRCSFLTEEAIGDNNFILEDNTIQPFVKIGSNNVIWSGNHIGHDVEIKDHCFISSHVVVSGFTRIENNCFLGVNSTLRDDITIGKYAIIGAGVSMMHNVNPYEVYLTGKPRKLNKKSTELDIS